LTLWAHQAERTRRRSANHRSSAEKVALRREIATIVEADKPSRGQLRDAVRSVHAAAAAKPYEAMRVHPPAPTEHPTREKRRLPVEDW
jgi:putative transposase